MQMLKKKWLPWIHLLLFCGGILGMFFAFKYLMGWNAFFVLLGSATVTVGSFASDCFVLGNRNESGGFLCTFFLMFMYIGLMVFGIGVALFLYLAYLTLYTAWYGAWFLTIPLAVPTLIHVIGYVYMWYKPRQSTV